MQQRRESTRLLVLVPVVAFGLALLLPGSAMAGAPITISILDNGGDWASTGVIIENYKKANPDKVKEIKLQRGTGRRLCARREQAAHPAVPNL